MLRKRQHGYDASDYNVAMLWSADVDPSTLYPWDLYH